MIHIIFRACNVVDAVNKHPRPFGLDKAALIKICFKSLYKSALAVAHTITVLGDKLSPEMMSFFSEYNVTLSNGDYGNSASIRKGLETALQFKDENDWIYFCEDDYLHRIETFSYINNLLASKEAIFPGKFKKSVLPFLSRAEQPNIAIFPSDYPDRYWPKDRTQHFIFHTQDCHWRQVANTTFTFLMQLKDVRKFQPVILKASLTSDDAYLSKKLYGIDNFRNKLLCVAPIPSLTAHMHVDTLPPLIDWEKIVSENA